MTVLVDCVYAVPSEIGDNRASAARDAARRSSTPTRDDSFTSREADARALQLPRGTSPGSRASSIPTTADARARAEPEGRLLPEGVQALLSRTTISPRRCSAMSAPTTTASAAWSASSTTTCTASPGHMLTAVDAQPPCARQRREPAHAGRESRAHHRREHPVHGRARAGRADGEDEGRSTAPSWCRTRTPARFSRSPSRPASIPNDSRHMHARAR